MMRTPRRRLLILAAALVSMALSWAPSGGLAVDRCGSPTLEVQDAEATWHGSYVVFPAEAASLIGTGWGTSCDRARSGSGMSWCSRQRGPDPTKGIRVWIVPAGRDATTPEPGSFEPTHAVIDLGTYDADEDLSFMIPNVTMPKRSGDYVFVVAESDGPLRIAGHLRVL